MTEPIDAIGGYFELELSSGREGLHGDAVGFQTARSAFLALLRATPPSRVWLPRYTCDAMVAPVRAAGIPHAFYSLTEDLEVADDLRFVAGDWIVCVRYFGLVDAPYRSATAKFGADSIVADHAQAYFAPPTDGIATLYSPRKFFGVPDGGFLRGAATERVGRPPPAFGSVRTEHLFKRLTDGAEAGYEEFLSAEDALAELEPREISSLTRRILAGVDLDAVAEARRRNFAFLHNALRSANRLSLDMGADDVPLCYPLLVEDASLRDALRHERIYTARYWTDVLPRCGPGSIESRLATNLVAIPCDQRYSTEQLARVADVIGRRLA